MDVSSSPPGVHRVKAAPPGNIKSGLKAPPGNIKRREEKKEERKSTTTCKGVIHLKLDRAFEEGTQSREYYEWETSLRNKIANSLGLSPETIIITGVEKGDMEHQELSQAVESLKLDRTTRSHELSMKHLKEMEYVALTRDTTESDLKQRREIVNSSDRSAEGKKDAVYFDQGVVKAALQGRVLVL